MKIVKNPKEVALPQLRIKGKRPAVRILTRPATPTDNDTQEVAADRGQLTAQNQHENSIQQSMSMSNSMSIGQWSNITP